MGLWQGNGIWKSQRAGGSSGLLQSATVTLTTEQIAALHETAVTLVEAQGAGKVIAPVSCVVTVDDGAPFDASGVIYLKVGADEIMVMADANGDPGGWPFGLQSVSGFLRVRQEAISHAENEPLTISTTESFGESGGIGSVSVNSGGTGYAIGDTGEIDQGALYEVADVEDGVVTSVTITSPGSQYTDAMTELETAAITGAGEGLTLDVASLATPTLTANVTVHYVVVDV